MLAAPTPIDEIARRTSLRQLNILDSASEAEFDAIAKAVSLVCGVPISLVSLVDADRQWFKANHGLPQLRETSRDMSFCAHTILAEGVLEIRDTLKDPRFAGNPLVTSEVGIRFYAGAPLTLSNGARVGALCIMDTHPRELTQDQRNVLTQLADAVVAAMEQRRAALAQATSEARVELLVDATGAGTWEWSALTQQLRINSKWSDLVGIEPGIFLNTKPSTWLKTIHPLDLAEASQKIEAHLSGHAPDYDCDLRIRHRDGYWLWVHAHGQLKTRTLDGRPEWVIGTLVDISSRKQQELALAHSEQLLNRTGEVAGVGGWEVIVATGEIILSDETCRIYGFDPAYRPQMDEAISFYEPSARPLISSAVQRAITHGESWDLELPFVRSDGEKIWVRTVGHVELDEDKQPVRLYGALQDISERVRQHQLLVEQHKLLHVTLNSIADAVVTTDADAVVNWLNPVAERLTGWLCGEALGKHIDLVVRTRRATGEVAALTSLHQCLQDHVSTESSTDTILLARNGEEFGISESVAAIRDSHGNIRGTVLVFRDVSDQRRAAKDLHYRATHDALTGLFNRSEFEHRLYQLLAEPTEGGSSHALLYIDLDQFKLVNDACGHAVGDQLLRQVSGILRGAIRSRDTLARLGGDEFAIILQGSGRYTASNIAQEICDRMEDFRFTHDCRTFRIGTSIGLVPLDQQWTSVATVMQAADAACFAAKESGRNRVHVWFDTDMAIHARRGEVQWASRIEEALDQDRFVLFAQHIEPVVGRSRGVYAEVLVRMVGEEGQLVSPGLFLPAAERFHLAPRVDRWVLRNTIRYLQSIPDLGHIDTVSVNVSGQSIGDRTFHQQALDKLAAAGPEICRRLCLEVTETSVVTNMADAVEFVSQVHALGVRVALDDFGAGASSFGYLKSLHADVLKIDGQYIQGLLDNVLNEAAVRCFVDVARVVGIPTVAEFVDSPAILARIKEWGVDYAQGYLLHQPSRLETVFNAPLAVAA